MVPDIFVSTLARLTERQCGFGEVIGAAQAVTAAGQPALAEQLYKVWIAFNPQDPLLAAANFNLAILLLARDDVASARHALEQAVAANPKFYPAYINLGSVIERMGEPGAAIAQWLALTDALAAVDALNIKYKASALKQIGRVLETTGQLPAAEQMLQHCLSLLPNQDDVAQHLLLMRLQQCKWPVVVPWDQVDRRTLMLGMSPLLLAGYTDNPMLQLASAARYSRQWDPPEPAPLLWRQTRDAAAPRLRIGYVSSDLRGHAVGYLMAELFEVHDRSAVEVFAYYCGPASTEPLHVRIKAAVEHWRDISAMGDAESAAMIAADGIDILIDVNGNTRDMRTGVFARKPAPILVNWLGFPGTMASPYHHYIIADAWIIPPEHELYFSEKVVRLPCYQPNDRKRTVAPERPSRAEAQLPEGAFVYCCFNGAQKINRFTFERWMTILKRVPDSVLWLLDASAEARGRLAEMAEQSGVAGDRLVFAPRKANPQHLARYALADLFLDTAPYGAHTTAADSLWMGVPVLTIACRGFAGRVCGSLVRSAGVPELVCASPEEYVERAIALAGDAAEMERLKRTLAGTRDNCVLFDTDLLARSLEGLYRGMWDDFAADRLPRPDLRNLDIYLEVALGEDYDALDVLTVADYDGWYRDKLARRHAIRPIPPDARLWMATDVS